MKYSDIKKVNKFCTGLFSEPNYKEVINNIESSNDDFEVDGVRFIQSEYIDDIQQNELLSDLYCLGCFNAYFLADYLPIDMNDIQAIQDAGAYEAIGKMCKVHIADIQAGYVSADGYGHHFNHYDGNEEELNINGVLYHVFDNH